jgi:RNA polymerase sigma factor (sigma-70 family)
MTDWPGTRFSLLVRIRDSRDEEAWRNFVDLYGPLVYSLARRRQLQDADAADVVQETLQAVAFALRRRLYDREKGHFRQWMYTIARNKTLNFLARSRDQPQTVGNDIVGQEVDEQQMDLQTAAEKREWDREYEQRLFAAAAESVRRSCRSPKNWEAFWRTAVEGKPAPEVARELTMPLGSVYCARSRIQAQITEQVRLLQEAE